MKWLVLTLALLLSSAANAQIFPEQTMSTTGMPLVRIRNNTPAPISCFLRDDYNFVSFAIPPYSASYWYPVYGIFQWHCNF
jgi:hypothetical protein